MLDLHGCQRALQPPSRLLLLVEIKMHYQIFHADKIAFHLTDWNAEAAFIVASTSFPGGFTPEEIRDGVEAFLIHAPHHVIAAARLAGHPTEEFLMELLPMWPNTYQASAVN